MAETKKAVNSKLATWSQQQHINRKFLKRGNKIALLNADGNVKNCYEFY